MRANTSNSSSLSSVSPFLIQNNLGALGELRYTRITGHIMVGSARPVEHALLELHFQPATDLLRSFAWLTAQILVADPVHVLSGRNPSHNIDLQVLHQSPVGGVARRERLLAHLGVKHTRPSRSRRMTLMHLPRTPWKLQHPKRVLGRIDYGALG